MDNLDDFDIEFEWDLHSGDKIFEHFVRDVTAGQLDKVKQARQRLREKVKAPPFIRTTDKIVFTLGVFFIIVTEYVLLSRPEMMHRWYISSVIPLLVYRYYSYHKARFHYFMLDFCYFVQITLLFYLVYYPNSRVLFQLVFAISNGPLMWGIVAWNNSLVFHDPDKMTSCLIHFMPPLVTFCLRWYGDDYANVCETEECNISWASSLVQPICFYMCWQIAYILKTEFIDKDKINERDYMTSLRWMTERKPHPIYRTIKKHQYKFMLGPWMVENPSYLLALVQLLYTIIVMTPVKFLYESYTVHACVLGFVFFVMVWNGAGYYFEVFSRNYAKRLNAAIQEANPPTKGGDAPAAAAEETPPQHAAASASS